MKGDRALVFGEEKVLVDVEGNEIKKPKHADFVSVSAFLHALDAWRFRWDVAGSTQAGTAVRPKRGKR